MILGISKAIRHNYRGFNKQNFNDFLSWLCYYENMDKMLLQSYIRGWKEVEKIEIQELRRPFSSLALKPVGLPGSSMGCLGKEPSPIIPSVYDLSPN